MCSEAYIFFASLAWLHLPRLQLCPTRAPFAKKLSLNMAGPEQERTQQVSVFPAGELSARRGRHPGWGSSALARAASYLPTPSLHLSPWRRW